MEIKKWVRKQLTIISLSLSNVEKNSLSQNNEGLGADTNQSMRLNQGKISDSLINGEITQEVIDLRWRTYKILKATEGITSKIVGYDKDGLPITETKKSNKNSLKNVLLDDFDSYPLEMVIDNSNITMSMGEIENKNDLIIDNPEKPIKIIRNNAPNFELESFTKQLKIRCINETSRLLEFYVSIYPDEFNRTSRLFINNVKKGIENPFANTMLEIEGVEFLTYKNLGVDDFLYYKYEIDKFDKIIEFNGFYVIKFIANVITNGDNIFEKYKAEELEDKYINKLKK